MNDTYVVLDASTTLILHEHFFWKKADYEWLEGYMFTESELEDVKSIGAIHWDVIPIYKQKARWEGDHILLTGLRESFWD